MNANYALPTVAQELDRKSFETIEWLFNSVDKGKISKFQFKTGIDTLFMSVAGLVDSSLFDLVSAANATIGTVQPSEDYHFIKDDSTLSLKWQIGKDYVRTVIRKNGKVLRNSDRHFDTATDAKFYIGMAVNRMVKEGFEQL